MAEIISSGSNRKIRYVEKLLKNRRFRNSEKKFAAEGIKITREAVSSGAAEAVFLSDKSECGEFDGFPEVFRVTENVFKKISDTVNSQGVVSICRMPVYSHENILKNSDPLIIALDGLSDPGNLGTIVRTALGAGADGIIMSRETVDLFNPKVVRATMGAIFRVPFIYEDDLPEALLSLKSRNIRIFATFPADGGEYYKKDFTEASCIIIGNEANGISEDVKKISPEPVNIPMSGGLESLNAAVSAAVLLYEARRQREV